MRLAEASTSAVFADDKVAGEIALDAMYHWAKNKALTETKKCYSSSTNGIAKNCHGRESDGDPGNNGQW